MPVEWTETPRDRSPRQFTARRILAVKAAIDANGTAKKIALESFASADVKVEALRRGFTDAELPKLARAAHFYAEATGVDETAAMRAVAEPRVYAFEKNAALNPERLA